MKKYTVQCLQGTDFLSRTHTEPLTEAELIELFRDLWDAEGFDDPFPEDADLELCACTWHLDICEVPK